MSPPASSSQDTGLIKREASPSFSQPVDPPKSQILSDLQKSFTSFLPCPIAVLLVAFIIVVVAVAAQLHPNATDYHSPKADCLRIVGSASSLERFPLPYPVSFRAHQDITNLNELPNLEMLARLNSTHSAVYSTLATTTQSLVGYIYYATKLYDPFPSRYTIDAFYADTLFVSEQLRLAAFHVNSLAEAYDTLQKDYYALMDTTNEALKQRQLSATTKFLTYAQPGGLSQRLGVFDALTAHLTPLEKDALNVGKVFLGVVALTRERQRVMEIKHVVNEVERILQLLARAVRKTKTSSHRHRMKSEKSRESIQKLLKEWYDRNVIQNGELKENWIELLASADKGEKEEVLRMKISPEWCPL